MKKYQDTGLYLGEQDLASEDPHPATDGGAYDVVVVGAGLSGLTAAYRMPRCSMLILDREPTCGGNARGETWEGIEHATAGTVIEKPEPDSRVGRLLKDLGIYGRWQEIGNDAIVLFDKKRLAHGMSEFAQAVAKSPFSLFDKSNAKIGWRLMKSMVVGGPRLIPIKKRPNEPLFRDFFAYLDQFTKASGKHPSIPWIESCGWSRKEFEAFDRISMHQLLRDPPVNLPRHLLPPKRFGDLVYEIAAAVLRVECLTLREISAYVGLNFLTCYLYGTLVAYPGGNGHITCALVRALENRPNVTFSTESKVLRIEPSVSGRTVTYRRGSKCFAVRAKVVIFAAPKFIAARIVPDMPDEQRKAIGRMSYRGFAMATALLSQPLWPELYGGYVIDDQGRPVEQHAWCKGGAFVIPSWATKDRSRCGLITLLKPIVDTEEQARLASTGYSALSNATRAELTTIIEAGGLHREDIVDIKLWRWPRSIIAPTVGDMSDRIFDHGRRPLEGLIFAGQDTYGLGNVEGAVEAGVAAAREALSEAD